MTAMSAAYETWKRGPDHHADALHEYTRIEYDESYPTALLFARETPRPSKEVRVRSPRPSLLRLAAARIAAFLF